MPGLFLIAEMMVLDKEDGRWAEIVQACARCFLCAADVEISSFETDVRCAFQSVLL